MDEKKVREAIEAFQGQVDWLKRIDDKRCEESRRCCIEYFETAIEALEKQLPKKPKKLENGDLACSCGLIIQRKNRITCLYYCHNCGQKIKWSE